MIGQALDLGENSHPLTLDGLEATARGQDRQSAQHAPARVLLLGFQTSLDQSVEPPLLFNARGDDIDRRGIIIDRPQASTT